MASISSEYTGDEKHQRDNSTSEKHSNIAMVAPAYSSLTRNIVRSHTTLVSGAKTKKISSKYIQIVNLFRIMDFRGHILVMLWQLKMVLA